MAEGPTAEAGTRRRIRRALRRYRIVTAVAFGAFAAFTVATGRLSIWPDLPELPGRVDAIVELGGPGDRDDAALALAWEHRPNTTRGEARSIGRLAMQYHWSPSSL